MTDAEREAFELLPDDERQCEVCKTTCFLSAMTCSCSSDTLVCLRHYTALCKCPPQNHTLRYRYTLDELPLMLQKLKLKAESFDHWVNKVKEALDPNIPKTMDLTELKALLNEADGKKFPKSDLLQTLTNAVEDAEKCASVIQQLDLNKIRTRTRNSSDAKYKLTMEELVLFCEEIDSLACILEEGKSVKELLQQTKQFVTDSSRLLNMPLTECTVQDLEKCLDQGNSLCIELPALRQVNQRLQQVMWLKDVKTLRKRIDVIGMDALRNLIQAGVQLPKNGVMEKELDELQGLLTESEAWEEKAQKLLKERGPNLLTDAERLVMEAEDIEVYLPTEEVLLDAFNRAKEWTKKLEEMNSAEYYPYYNAMEELIKNGRAIPLQLEEVGRLETYLQAASAWKEKTCRTFLRKNCSTSLMDALSPRVSIMASAKNKKKGQEEDSVVAMLNDNMDPVAVVSIFKEAEDREMEGIRNLRAANLAKSLDPNDCCSFCICQRGLFGLMMQCELCKDWFHSICVQLPKIATCKIKKNFTTTSLHMGFKDCKFLCTNCFRTRRPRLETILSLLMSLQKLYTRVPEGEALQCLTERAMNWQDRARQLLQHSELETAVAKLSLLMQKYTEAAAREKTEKIISSELKKAASNPELHSRVQEIAPLSGISGEEVDVQPDSSGYGTEGTDETSKTGSPTSTDDCMGEHAYSLHISKVEDNECTIQLSPEIRQQLEDLLMEGNLLEVSLDETLHLWKLVQISRDPEKDIVLIDFDVSLFLFHCRPQGIACILTNVPKSPNSFQNPGVKLMIKVHFPLFY